MRSFLLAAAVLLVACSDDPVALPDRSDPAVRAEEQRLATLLGQPGNMVTGPATCRVRLLRREGSVSWAWAHCEAKPTADNPYEGTSGPVRVDGTTVSRPGDGSEYGEGIRRLFPDDLEGAVLERDERIFP